MTYRGFTISLFGVDGSGKSTVATLLQAMLEKDGYRCTRRHWRPRILPGRRKDGGFAIRVANPDANQTRGLSSSITMTVYIWLDFLAGWLLSQRLYRRGAVIIHERYFDDMWLHPRRYGLDDGISRLALLRRLVPRPALTFLLVGDAAIIHQRKSELSETEISRQQSSLRELFTPSTHVIEVNVGTLSPDQIVATVLQHIDQLRRPG